MFINHFNLEDFSKDPSKLIFTRKDTNILNFICSEGSSKQEITKHIVNSVKKRDKSCFPTHSHIIWAMECIGYSFSLPIESHSTISSALDIYRNWLTLGTEDRPEIMSENESFYQQEIINHVSLLFVERGGDLHRHADLCKEVLLMLKDLCRQKFLHQSTWEHLLSIFLMMSASVLKSSSLLSREITPLLFKVLFEIWLRSNTRKSELWADLSSHSTNWIRNIWIVHHWTAVELALTKSVIGLIYGNETQKLKILFKNLPKPFECEAEIVQVLTTQEQNIYFWYQFWELMKKKTLAVAPKDPELCKELVKSVASLTDQILNFAFSRNSESRVKFDFFSQNEPKLDELLQTFQEIHEKFINRKNTVPIPRVNSILYIFGTWLFEYANNELNYCELGRAVAVGALCRIFSSDLGPVHRSYCGNFYWMLAKLFRGESSIAIKKFLKHSNSLFASHQPGIRLLADKDYLLRLIQSHIRDKKMEVKVRFYCYKILSTFVLCLSCDTKLESVQMVQDVLLDGIMNESDTDNLKIIAWIACCFLLVVPGQVDIVQSLILSLVNRLKNITHDQMYSDLISVIATAPFLVCKKTIFATGFAQKIVTKLCGYINKRLYCHTDIIVELLFALQKWVRRFDFVLNEQNIRLKILDVLASTKLSDKGGTLSEFIEEFTLFNLGFFYPTLQIQESVGVEMPRGLTECVGNDWKHFWVYGSTLMSFKGNSEDLVVVIRNRMGRTIWKKIPVYIKNEKKSLECIILDVDSIFQVKQPEDKNPDFELNEKEFFYQSKINLMMSSQQTNQFKGSERYSMKKGIFSTQKDFLLNPRVLLSQLGLLDFEEKVEIFEIETETACQVSRDLDRSSQKDTFFLSVLFLSSSTSSDYLSMTDSFTSNFKNFLMQLGVRLDESHISLGYLSHLSIHIDHYSTILFTSDSSHDIISVVPCLAQTEMSLSETTGASRAVVIWNSRQDDNFSIINHDILKSPEMEHKDCIILTPLKENLVKVNLNTKAQILGPLVNNMVVPLTMIGKLVLYSVVNLTGNSLEVVESRKNRQSLLTGLDLLIRQSRKNYSRLNDLMEYCFA
jgi:hypothetical protein